MSFAGLFRLLEALDRTPEEFLKECPFAVLGLAILLFSIVWSLTVGWENSNLSTWIMFIAIVMIAFGLTPSKEN